MKTSLLFLVLVSTTAWGQFGTGGNIGEKFYWGGGIGLNAGRDFYNNRYLYFAISPIIGYRATDRFSVGTGITWQLYSFPDANITLHQYGISPFARYDFDKFFLFSEYALLNTPTFSTHSTRKTYSRLLMGGGLFYPIGQRGAVNIMLLYDVLYNNSERAFPSPWVTRVFFTF